MTIEELLQKKDIEFLPKGKDLLVRCFNPEHDDSNPSMRIDRETGLYHCLSCGHKGNLLKDFNQVSNKFLDKAKNLLYSIQELRSTKPMDFPVDADFNVANFGFRGLSEETLLKFKAFKSEKEFPDRIVLPIFDASGMMVAQVGRYDYSKSQSAKYLMKPADVIPPLFPAPQYCTFNDSTMIMVEGVFDVVNLHDKGATNAVSSLGTKSLSYENVYEKLVPYMVAGVTKIIIAYDGDMAGRVSAEKLKDLINRRTPLTCKVYNLPEGVDPGDLNQKEVNQLVNFISSL